MKLKFNIHYNTEWGQQMHVVVNYLTNDRHEREQDFLMQTQDGTEWMLDVVLMESRQRSILSFHYVYQVEDSDGHILRREWDQVKRTYAADSMKTFVFADLWRDRPLNYPLYTYFNKRYEPGISSAVARGRIVGTDWKSSCHRQLESHTLPALTAYR